MDEKRSLLRRAMGRLWRRRWWVVTFILLVGFGLLNVLAFTHARGMLVYEADGSKPPAPDSLSTRQKLQVLVCGVRVPRPTITRTPADLSLPYETVRFTADDGVRLEGWLIAPSAPRGTVLLFHGYSASRSTLLDEARALIELNYTALLVDFRGCGASDGHVTTLGYDEARDVTAALKFARAEKLPRPLILYGQSMGGAAVLRSTATSNVRPDGIIVESVFARLLGAVRNRFAMMNVPSYPAAELLVFWGGVQVGFSGFQHNPEEYARSCDCPTLLLHGTEDRHALLNECTAIRDHLPGTKEMVVFDQAGHQSLYKSDPPRWTAAVQAFLESLN